MPLEIAICEDEKQQLAYLEQLVNTWLKTNSFKARVSTFNSAEAFSFAWCEDRRFDIFLLDIQMPGQNGIELARQLRADHDDLVIIFITALPDYIQEGYDVAALHYLMKPIKEYKLYEVLDRAVERLKLAERSLLFQTSDATVKVPLDDILYIEAFAHYVIIQTKTTSLETRVNIGEIERTIGNEFVRCHRSYIVGLNHISHITKTDIMLDSGKNIPLSRRLYTTVNLAFINYHKGRKI